MSFILSLALGTCMVIVVGGLVTTLLMWADSRNERQKRAKGSEDLATRVGELERRLTDTQDIVISLSEKLDRIESAVGDTTLQEAL